MALLMGLCLVKTYGDIMYEYNAILRKVVDGDTVDLDIDLGFDVWLRNKRVRLNGIDTPEKRTSNKLEKFFGLLASKYVENKLDDVKKIRVATKIVGGIDKYGRVLGTIFIDDDIISLNTHLIGQRLAVEYTGQNKLKIKAEHADNMKYLVENDFAKLPLKIQKLYEEHFNE
jgi:micrococcal nuclease